jgi:hypothetical protein
MSEKQATEVYDEMPPEEEESLEDQYIGDPPDDDDDIPGEEPVSDDPKDRKVEVAAPKPSSEDAQPVLDIASSRLQLDMETITAANQVGIAPHEAERYTSQRALDNEIIRRVHENRVREGQKAPAQYALSLDELGLDEVDPSIKEALKKVAGHYERQFESMQARLGDYEREQLEWKKQTQASSTAENQRQFNNWKKSVPQLEEVLGPGEIQDLRQGTPEFANMQRLAEEVFVLSKAEAARPSGSKATPEDIFNRAAGIVFAEHMSKQSATKLRTDLKNRSRQATSRPAARKLSASTRDSVLEKWDKLHVGDGSPVDDDPDPDV